MRITFFGAAREVTGSCYLVEGEESRFLVDCGMFQGGREAYGKNLRALAFDLRHLDFVLLSHAHLDHAGLLPRLCALGYRGPIYMTSATADLLRVMLLDAAHIQEKEAEWENKHYRWRHAKLGYERGPLYTVAQAQNSLRQIHAVDYDREFVPHPGIRVRFRDAGHILGSAILEIDSDAKRLVFSGDIGQPGRPILRNPFRPAAADVLVVESTYGNRLHKSLEETEEELVGVLRRTLRDKGGNVIVPAFSVGRTQEVLFILADLVRRGRVDRLDVYVDSPMAISATELTLKHQDLLDGETQELMRWQREHPDKLKVRFVQDVQESIALNSIRSGAVIISASGMCEAGRIKYHLQNNLPRSECSVAITGFQANGTLGRRLVDGAKLVKIFGQPVAVRAEIHTLGGLSAHADRAALLEWLGNFVHAPRRTFVVHGEAETALGFADSIREELHWTDVAVPQAGQCEEV